MPYFDRFDICEAYLVFEWDWHKGGWLQERPSNKRRMESTDVQLTRMQFKPSPLLSFETLTENGKEIYVALGKRLKLIVSQCETPGCNCFEPVLPGEECLDGCGGKHVAV